MPLDAPLHLVTGVPNNFTPIQLAARDTYTVRTYERQGSAISAASARCQEDYNNISGDPLRYYMSASSTDGTILVLPDGADRVTLQSIRKLVEAAKQQADEWYKFAQQRLLIDQSALCMITELYKAPSWVIASPQRAGSALMEVTRSDGRILATCHPNSGWQLRAGPSNGYVEANQTIFIRKLHITITPKLFGTVRRVQVVDFDSRPPRTLTSAIVVGHQWESRTSLRTKLFGKP